MAVGDVEEKALLLQIEHWRKINSKMEEHSSQCVYPGGSVGDTEHWRQLRNDLQGRVLARLVAYQT
jgi:hypothetical protein